MSILYSNDVIQNYDSLKTAKIKLLDLYKKNINDNKYYSLLFDDRENSLIKPNYNFDVSDVTNLSDIFELIDAHTDYLFNYEERYIRIPSENLFLDNIFLVESSVGTKYIEAFFLRNDVNIFVDLGNIGKSDSGSSFKFDVNFPPKDKLEQESISPVQDATVYDSTIIDTQSINDAILINYVKITDSIITIQIKRPLTYFEKVVITKYMQFSFNVRNIDDYNNVLHLKKKVLFEDICNVL